MKQPSRSRGERKPESVRLAAADKILVIFNPAARSERAARLRDKIQALGARAVVRPTGGPDDARALAARAVEQGYRVVVAAGGDGTINEVVNGLAGSDVTLGLLPLGTMNVFAAEMGIPSNQIKRCWEIIEAGHVREVDLARANTRHFVQLAGVGFDAQAVAGVDWEAKKSLGPLSYIISAAKVAAQRPPELTIECADGGGTRKGSFVLVGNGRYYGGRVTVFKGARNDDGLLDVLVFKNQGHLDIIRYIQGVFMGTHLTMSGVEHFRTRGMTVRATEGGQDVPFEADGELVGYAPVTFQITSQRLKVLAPAPAANP